MTLLYLTADTPAYPLYLTTYLAGEAPNSLTAWGNPELLRRRSLAFFCSAQCPGSLILQSHDLAQQLRQSAVPVISSFHSPIEKEGLTVLLRGQNPLIICPARSLTGLRLRAEWQEPLAQGRLLLLSPFAAGQRRPTAAMAQQRNRLVGALAEWIFIAYASPGGKIEQVCREFVAWGKPVHTFEHEATAGLVQIGARPVGVEGLEEVWGKR
jgi:predicted Rossmann fold nucleotide-binding protein DprA/Smf involved in DNA uptake